MYNGDKKYLWITVAAGGKDWSTPSACEAGRRVCHAYLIIIVIIFSVIIMIVMINYDCEERRMVCHAYLIIIVVIMILNIMTVMMIMIMREDGGLATHT